MLSPKIGVSLGLWVAICLPLSGCNGEAIQQAFSADPQASQWGSSSSLPSTFPDALKYPNASLQGVQQRNQPLASDSRSQQLTQQTRWVTPDSSQIVQRYYGELVQKGGWQLTGRRLSQQQLILLAKRDRLNVRITIPASRTLVPVQPGTNGAGRRVPMTVFFIDYSQAAKAPVVKAVPKPGDRDFVGPVKPDQEENQSQNSPSQGTSQIPADLGRYVNDLQKLGVLDIKDPNQPMQRGLFARWLVETNNRLYQDRSAQQIRLATSNQKPAFQDVPSTDPNFPYIQGLAEAGFIPSPLSGDANQTTFQPNQPLTREVLLTWKVPIDFRKILPSTTPAKVQEVWGFKDTQQISTPALSAIFADHNNGELANIRRLMGSAVLLQPKKTVTQAEAAATLWFIGIAGEGYSAKDVLRAEQQAEATNPS